MPAEERETVAVVGLGYVGLPVALAFARQFPTVGFDIDEQRVTRLRAHQDDTGEVSAEDLQDSSLRLSTEPSALEGASFVIVAVPTSIDRHNRPDLASLVQATETVGAHLRQGAVVVYESTVYPGVTEDVCAPLLAAASGLVCGRDFALGYSPERINPGDQEHRFERITKVVAAQDEHTLERVARVYGAVVDAGVHRAASIKVAEAAKVIENTQRDLNIALMNELALICDRLGLRTKDVLDVASTKWNFLPFAPGLVGGHCIGVDPYYLTAKAQQLGYQPEVILAGRRINNGMSRYVAQRTVKLLSADHRALHRCRVAVCGLTFKENITDLRRSLVPDLIEELRAFDIEPLVHDPLGDPERARSEHDIRLCSWDEVVDLDALVLAVAHSFYTDRSPDDLLARVRPDGIVVDVKSMLDPSTLPEHLRYWSL